MKTKFTKLCYLFLITIVIAGCTRAPDEINHKAWEGFIYRTDNQQELARVRLYFDNNKMYIYSNAIFGTERDTLKLKSFNKKDSVLTYENNTSEAFMLEMFYYPGDTLDLLSLAGKDFTMGLFNDSATKNRNVVPVFYNYNKVPRNAYMYMEGSYTGDIYRLSDELKLSETAMEFHRDSLFVLSNAIFGAENDTMFLKDYNEEDTTLLYKSPAGTEIALYIHPYNPPQNYFLVSDDFFIEMNATGKDIFSPSVSKFYLNRNVPRDAGNYLNGTYEGVLEFEDAAVEMLSLFTMGQTTLKYVFINGYQVENYGKNYLIGGTKETMTYRVSSDTLYLSNEAGQPAGHFLITSGGQRLVAQDEDFNLVLNKIY
ncbi:MAG: hypothetical protein R6V32_02545 [Bacteroidales bacterium]